MKLLYSLILLTLALPAIATEYAPIALDGHANLAPAAGDLLAAPRRSGDFDEIDGVEVRLVTLAKGPKTQLAVGLMGSQSTAVRGIPIGYSGVRSLHFFHSVLKGNLRAGSFVCKYVVHFQNGRIVEIPVVVGQDIGSSQIAQGVPNARAIQAVVDGDPRPSFVYHLVCKNPRPKDRIATLDIIAVSPNALTALSALSLELQPPAKLSSRLSQDLNTLARLRASLRSLGDSAAISLLGSRFSAAANKTLREQIDSADAATSEVLSLRKSLRTAAEAAAGEPKDFSARLATLTNKRNAIQEALTRLARSQ